MLDGRIYRTGLAVVALAILVLGFSFRAQPAPLSTSLAPDAFNGQNVLDTMGRLSTAYPNRPPGSAADYDLASQLAGDFRTGGYNVTTDAFSAQTAVGRRTLENVVAVRPGIQSGSVVIVAARDARGTPSAAGLSGTATELELARALAGETLHRTVVLASTSGSQGTAGAIRLASTLSGPVDAVIVLGDLASAHVRQPVVVPWSSSQAVAPPALRNTLAGQLSQQAALGSRGTSLFGQFTHLAFPLTISNQAPFGGQGIPAVLLSVSGERGPTADAPLAGPDRLTAVGRAVLGTISAVDGGSDMPSPSSYLLLSGKLVPGWATSLFILALIVPVALVTIDGLARARRHGHIVWRWLVVVLAAAVPFALGATLILAAGLTGLLPVTPPAPIPAQAIPLDTGGVVVLAGIALVCVAAFLLLRPVVIRLAVGSGSRRRVIGEYHEGVVAAVLVVMCAVTVAIWVANPFAAALAVPALHLWLAALSPDLRLRIPFRVGLLLLGLAPVLAVAGYYAFTLGYGPSDLAWSAALLLAGHGVSLGDILGWSVFWGCAVVGAGVLVLAARQPRPEQVPVTVRGPVSYAGPGSLGGTESALRR
ncbi:MAG: hypothetical protein M3016_09395 [Actinomycetota bacterium]|nr:hypothetical protein [Actinomycetota bacterium]